MKETKARPTPKKLHQTIYRELKILLKHPGIGIKTDFENVYCIITGDYMIYYKSVNEGIVVHAIWDCRQNPNDKPVK